jgi:hypothetical protein
MSAPDLTLFTLIHRLMREDAARLAGAVAGLTEPARATQGAALARWYAGYLDELHDHHHIEDHIFLPAMAAKVPAAAPHVTRIDADHLVLDELLTRTTNALGRVADVSVDFTTAHAEATDAARALRDLIEGHLSFEDIEVLPVFAAHFSGEEFEALEKQAMGKPNLKHLAFTLPWVVDGATPAERSHIFASAPFAFKVLYYATRRRYRRTRAVAFAGSPALPVRA